VLVNLNDRVRITINHRLCSLPLALPFPDAMECNDANYVRYDHINMLHNAFFAGYYLLYIPESLKNSSPIIMRSRAACRVQAFTSRRDLNFSDRCKITQRARASRTNLSAKDEEISRFPSKGRKKGYQIATERLIRASERVSWK